MPPFPDTIQEKYYAVDEHLEKWFAKIADEDFPFKKNYRERYGSLHKALEPRLKRIEIDALLAEFRRFLEEGVTNIDELAYLTNHGPEHVRMVIDRASDLLCTSNCVISAYEGYILLASIMAHDLGNALGRKDHEENVINILNDVQERNEGVFQDVIEKYTIAKIAVVHGGIYDESKDVISKLEEKRTIFSKPIRMRFLAAILRFADELADDATRADRYRLEAGTIPEESQIYHAYSRALKSVSISKTKIELGFWFDQDDAERNYKKYGSDRHLLSEIYHRVEKMHRERMYCMRFLRPNIDINRIEMNIEVMPRGSTKPALLDPIKIRYSLDESGYPNCDPEEFNRHCTGSESKRRMTSEELIETLKKREHS